MSSGYPQYRQLVVNEQLVLETTEHNGSTYKMTWAIGDKKEVVEAGSVEACLGALTQRHGVFGQTLIGLFPHP